MLTPAQRVIVAAHARLKAAEDHGDYFPDMLGDNSPYSGVDQAVARELAVTVETVGEALVSAGKRPPVWWAG